MGFGSYDESEQEKREFDTDFDDEEGIDSGDEEYEGEIEFEIGASNEELLDRLQDIKE